MKKLSIFLAMVILFTVCFSGCGEKETPVDEKQVTEETQPADAENIPEIPEEAEENSEEALSKEPASKEETKAISIPEKNAEKAIVMRICIIISMMVINVYCLSLSCRFSDCPLVAGELLEQRLLW